MLTVGFRYTVEREQIRQALRGQERLSGMEEEHTNVHSKAIDIR